MAETSIKRYFMDRGEVQPVDCDGNGIGYEAVFCCERAMNNFATGLVAALERAMIRYEERKKRELFLLMAEKEKLKRPR
jgi:hypothetical protein